MPASDPVDEVKGVGESRAAELNELGVETVGDLANLDNDDYSTFIENAQAYLAEEEEAPEEEEQEASESEEGDGQDDTSDEREAEQETSDEPEEDVHEASEPELVTCRIHGGHAATFEFLEAKLDHEVKDYKRYRVDITPEERDELIEAAGQPFVTPLA